jgi:hypothetical protein
MAILLDVDQAGVQCTALPQFVQRAPGESSDRWVVLSQWPSVSRAPYGRYSCGFMSFQGVAVRPSTRDAATRPGSAAVFVERP